jgi:hypothetical protein
MEQTQINILIIFVLLHFEKKLHVFSGGYIYTEKIDQWRDDSFRFFCAFGFLEKKVRSF